MSSPFQLGSTFKLVSTVAGLQSGLITPGSPFDDEGRYQIPNCDVARFKCIFKNAGRARGNGTISLATALTLSSDTYFYRIGAELQLAQNPTLQNVARQFGFGADSGIDLPGEISGTVPDAELKKRLAQRDPPVISADEGRGYFVGDNVLFAIGQGLLSATPLQLANSYATFANGGNRMRPMVASGSWPRARRTSTRRRRPGEPVPVPLAGEVQARGQGPGGDQHGLVEHDEPWLHRGRQQPPPVRHGQPHLRGVQLRRAPHRREDRDGAGRGPGGQQGRFALRGYGPNGGPGAAQWVVAAVIEDGGFGAWAAAPVVKCMFSALADRNQMAPLVQSEPLDKTATTPTAIGGMPNTACMAINDARGQLD